MKIPHSLTYETEHPLGVCRYPQNIPFGYIQASSGTWRIFLFHIKGCLMVWITYTVIQCAGHQPTICFMFLTVFYLWQTCLQRPNLPVKFHF